MRAKRIDANQPAVKLKFMQSGFAVATTSNLGNGFPDLVVMDKSDPLRRVYLIEVKDGSKKLSAQKLTPDEQAFAEVWPVHIIRSVGDVASWVARLRYDHDNPA